MNRAIATITCAAVVCSVGCGGDRGNAPIAAPNTARVALVLVTPGAIFARGLGAAYQLVASVRDSNESRIAGAPVTWTSSNAAVAQVAASGGVTTVGLGTATINHGDEWGRERHCGDHRVHAVGGKSCRDAGG